MSVLPEDREPTVSELLKRAERLRRMSDAMRGQLELLSEKGRGLRTRAAAAIRNAPTVRSESAGR